jgi:hypothetical protein
VRPSVFNGLLGGARVALTLAAPAARNPTWRNTSSNVQCLVERDTWYEDPIPHFGKVLDEIGVHRGFDVGSKEGLKEPLGSHLVRQRRDAPASGPEVLKDSIELGCGSALVVEPRFRVRLTSLRVE